MNLKLIHKYLNNEASEDEVQKIFDWIASSENNKRQFIELKKIWALTYNYHNYKLEPLNLSHKSRPKKLFKLNAFIRYAAIIVIIIGISGALIAKKKYSTDIVDNVITLEIENGEIITIDDSNTESILNSNGNILGTHKSNEIVYSSNENAKETVFNTINVPYGKSFKLVLSDSSVVYLNSGTIFKYPQNFVPNVNREVFLSGEAFFEVTENKTHPFIVNTGDMGIKVLGTQFNVNSYDDNNSMEVVLVEGSVGLSTKRKEQSSVILKPNQKAIWNEGSQNFDLTKVDTQLYTAWKNGELKFENLPFYKLEKTLERTFNVEIINKSNHLGLQKFTGTLNIKSSNIVNILDLLSIDTPFKYEIDDNIITITNQDSI